MLVCQIVVLHIERLKCIFDKMGCEKDVQWHEMS